MPMKKGYSKNSISKKKKYGQSKDQSVAIALDMAKRSKKGKNYGK